MQTTQQNAPLKRTMKTRHLIMLSLGGVIGTGLFFNTGYIISTTGAAGTLLAYLIGALVVWLVMQCLGELSVAMPETGAFHVYAARYLGPATGYTVAWLYWLGDSTWASGLLLWSVGVVTLDNFLRPALIRLGADLPLLLIFAGVLGGMLAFGLIGLFVGPVVLAVTWTLLQAWLDDAGAAV